MYKVVLLRHGESTWNMENRFTGWTDVDLSEHGRFRTNSHTGLSTGQNGATGFQIAQRGRDIRTAGAQVSRHQRVLVSGDYAGSAAFSRMLRISRNR